MDRAEALALATYRASLCPLCGRPLDECTSMEGEGPDFGVDFVKCRATAEILAVQRAMDKSKNADPDRAAYLFSTQTRR